MLMKMLLPEFLDNFKGESADEFSDEAKVALFNYLDDPEMVGEEKHFDLYDWTDRFGEFTLSELKRHFDYDYYVSKSVWSEGTLDEWAETMEKHFIVIPVYQVGGPENGNVKSLILGEPW